MSAWSFDTLSRALGKRLLGARPSGRDVLGRISTDTRSIEPGDVFLALRGEQFDGHHFLAVAVERGAKALIVSDGAAAAGCGVPVLLVEDTLEALGVLATAWRRTWGGVVVAVAGSNGKTSTKDLIAGALGGLFHVHATRGNLNNHIGVPLTLLSIPGSAQVAVVEIGTNHPGEVAALRAIAEPDVAVITSVGEEHLEGLGTLEAVLEEEVSVCEGVALVITPASQPEIGEAARSRATRVLEAGLATGDIHPDTWGMGDDARGWFTSGEHRASLQLVGEHNLRNATLALAVSRASGVPDETALAGLSAVAMPAMRSALQDVGSLTVLNDAYNANPASAREALKTIDAVGRGRPQVLVLGSMLELGETSDTLHDEIARRAVAMRASVIGGVGLMGEALLRVAPDDARVITAADAEQLWPMLRDRVPPNAVVLLKGSRGTRLERLVPHLHVLAGLTAVAPSTTH